MDGPPPAIGPPRGAPIMNLLQKAAAQAIVNIFETGRVRGDYGRVTLLQGDSGRLTYGRSQTTLASGNLLKLLRQYSRTPDALHAEALAAWLPAMEEMAPELDRDDALHAILRLAGEDPVMQRVQDAFFDRTYWEPAVEAARVAGISLPLGVGVVYDSFIHGSWGAVRKLTGAAYGTPSQSGGERPWIAGYVVVRREWLATRRNPLLRRTVYRMDAFLRLIAENRWELEPPFEVRGFSITRENLGFGEREHMA